MRSTQTAPTSPAPAATVPVTTPSLLSLPHARLGGPAAALPEQYGGDPVGSRAFLLACELYLAEYLELTSAQKISLIIQRLTTRALD